MNESTSWEHYAEESLTHDDYGTRPTPREWPSPKYSAEFVDVSYEGAAGTRNPEESASAAYLPCQHLYVSYHGQYRAECADCGVQVTEAAPVEIEIPMFFQTELRSDGEWPR
jgi:hypothetical protein